MIQRVEEFLSISMYIITDYYLQLIVGGRIKKSTLLVINKTKLLFTQKRTETFKIGGYFCYLKLI